MKLNKTTKILLALVIWFLTTVAAVQFCTWWNPNAKWVIGLGLLANFIQVGSTYALYHIFIKIHLVHKHIVK